MLQFFGRVSLALAAVVLAASLAVPAQAAEVKTKYFSIDLSADWTQPQPVQVYDMSGRLLHNVMVDGAAILPLSRGLYLVGGAKVLVP